MEMAGADVLLDPSFTVPAVPAAGDGMGWVRCMVPRFCEGDAHARRRALVERLIVQAGRPEPSSSPTAALLAALGLDPGLEADVAAVAAAYQPSSPASPAADAAADRLAAACGGRSEESAARVCVLVQSHAGTLALISRIEAGDGAPPIPATRRIAPDGSEVLVALAAAPFGAGRHECPGQALGRYLAEAHRP
ncbi:MAG TPA: hypothetical protein VH478_20770 [Trebonia sp.]|jgi:hypothetical protein|nr:hypothetical protein [Trebonia sp.]